MRTGIETVDKGQSEAALAIGYTKGQTFFKVVFPQAARNFIPVLKGEFISMVKMTSVVGYIAVQDLTKALAMNEVDIAAIGRKAETLEDYFLKITAEADK